MSINPNTPADFSPTLEGYTGQGAFKFWCQQVLPLVFDDSISYYELLNKVVVYLNNVIQDVSAAETNISALSQAYKQLEDYVNDYFSSLDVQQEINNKLDQMAQDTSPTGLPALIRPFVTNLMPGEVAEQLPGEVTNQIGGVVANQLPSVTNNLLNSNTSPVPRLVTDWLNQNVNPVGSAVTVDNSLSISDSAGDSQVTGDTIRMMGALPWKRKARTFLRKDTGDWSTAVSARVYESGYVDVTWSSGDKYIYKGRHIPNDSSACSVAFYDSNGDYIPDSAVQCKLAQYYVFSDDNIPNGTATIRFTSNRNTESEDTLIFEIYKLTKFTTSTSGGEVVNYGGLVGNTYMDLKTLSTDYTSTIPVLVNRITSNENAVYEVGCIPYTLKPTHGVYTYDSTNGLQFITTGYASFNTVEAVVDVSEGDEFIYRGNGGTGTQVGVVLYDANDNIISARSYDADKYHKISVNNGTAKILFSGHYRYTQTDDPGFSLFKKTSIITNFYDRIDTNENSISNLEQNVNHSMGAITYTTQLQGYYNKLGDFVSSARYTNGHVLVDVNEGDIFLYRGRGKNANDTAVSIILYSTYTDNEKVIAKTYSFDNDSLNRIVIPNGVVKMFATSFYYDSATPPIPVEDRYNKIVFDLYKDGTINKLYDMTKYESNSTLNICNRAYASATMNTPRTVDVNNEAVVCIGFDDYNLDCNAAVEWLGNQGIKSYLGLIPENVTDNWEMARNCFEYGGEICAHSKTPMTATNQTFELLNEKFIQIPEVIGRHGFPVYGILRAGGTDIETANDELNEFYSRASGMKYSDYYGKPISNSVYRLGRTNMTSKTLSQWRTALDDLVANHGFLILYCHHVNGTEHGFTFNDFKNLVNEITSRNIAILTINELVDAYAYGGISTDEFPRSKTELTIEGVPPIEFMGRANGTFTNYRVYGKGDGSETQTVNLIPQDYTLEQGTFDGSTGENLNSDSRVRTGVMTMPLMEDTNWRVCVSWKTKLNVKTEVLYGIYNTDGSYYAGYGWGSYRVDSMSVERMYDVLNTYRQFKLKLAFRREDNAPISPSDIYDIQVEYNRSSPTAYQPPVNIINGVGDIVEDSDNPNFCKYRIPITVGENTVGIYLDEPLIKGRASDYIDFATQKRYNSDGTEEAITLPAISFESGSNELSVGTAIQPSKVVISGNISNV